MRKPAFLIAADRSNSGKTIVTIGVVSALRQKGLSVAPFKCGPDFIDTAHLAKAASSFAYNLDSLFLGPDELKELFYDKLCLSDVAVIEGVMGFFDGIDEQFKASSYEIAKILNIPVVLVVDAKGMSYSLAAVVRGIQDLAKNVNIAGVIVNNIASLRHQNMIEKTLKNYTDVEIFGFITRNKELTFPSRHLGLTTAVEQNEEFYDKIGYEIKKEVELNKLLALEVECKQKQKTTLAVFDKKACIAYDEAFNFYYAYNIDALKKLGYEVEYFSVLKNQPVCDADFLYLGGGYPELYASVISKNKESLQSIREHILSGKLTLAECGGMIVLLKGIFVDNQFFDFSGVFDVKSILNKKKKSLGYVEVTDTIGRFFSKPLIGHEFHYSSLVDVNQPYALKIRKITTSDTYMDGFVSNATLASYTHFLFSKKFIKEFFGGVV